MSDMSYKKTNSLSAKIRSGGQWSGFALMLSTFAIVASFGAQVAMAGAGNLTLVTSHPQEPPSWDYWSNSSSAISAVTFINVRQPLLEVLADGSLVPLLAESWDISDDGLTVTFNIRDAKFTDGTDLDANDVVYSILKNKESPLGSISVPLSIVSDVIAVDENTVQLLLSVPSQRLMIELAKRPGIIVPEGAFENLDVAKEVVGTGPYIFSEYNPGVDVKLVRNDNYWGDAPYFENVTHRFIPDETAAINALLAGDIDVIGAVFGEGLERLEVIAARDGFEAYFPSPKALSYVFLDTTNKSLQIDSVRQAIAYGIDREALLIAGQNGLGLPTCQYMIPFSVPWNNDYCPYSYDPDKAIELLNEAGVEDLTLYFPYLTVAEFPALKEVLVNQMAQIGITLEAKPLDLSTWLEQVLGDQGEYDFGSLTTNAVIESYRSGAGSAPNGKPNSEAITPEFDRLVDSSDKIADYDEYLAAMAEMAKVFADDAWVIPLYSKNTPSLARADLQGIKSYRTTLEFDLRYLRLAE